MTRNLSDQLTHALSPEHLSLFLRIATLASQQGLPLYIVGGFVRDLLLNRPSTDFDFVVEGDAPHFAKKMAGQLGGTLTIHDKFRTATWIPPATLFVPTHRLPDFVSARRETYAHPAALPDVTLSTIDDDIRRRDFTINTLALRLDGEHFGELLDLLNGEQDLKDGVIRILHEQSFVDDPTRIFRAVRYAERLDFKLDLQTEDLIERDKGFISALSGERIRHEIELGIQEEDPDSIYIRLDDNEILSEIHPVLDYHIHYWADALRIRSGNSGFELAKANWISWLSQYSQEVLEKVIERLNFPGDLSNFIREVGSVRLIFQQLKTTTSFSEIHRQLREYSMRVLLTSIGLIVDFDLEMYLSSYYEAREKLHLTTNGNTIKALGLPPGPKYKDILFRLECAWLDEEINTPEEEQALLEKLVKEAK